jgi:iron complex transport system ATP-binding protein
MTLEVKNLSVAFEARPVLREMSTTFARGEITVVLGPNGVGKTTLLKAIVGVVGTTGGDVQFAGRSLRVLAPAQRARVLAYVPQRSHLHFEFSVREYVSFGRFGCGEVQEKAIDAALHEVELTARADEPFLTLSVGQQQRATIARALAQLGLPGGTAEGKVLLLDEPVASLDPAQSLRVFDLLARLAAAGLTIIAIVHDLSTALRHATSVLVLGLDGGVAASGPVAEVVGSGVLERIYGVKLSAPGPDDVVLIPRRSAPNPVA